MDNYRNEFHAVMERNKLDMSGDQGLIVNRWLFDPVNTAPASNEDRIIAWLILIAVIIAICGTAYLLFRHRARIWSGIKSAIAAVIVGAIKTARQLRAEVSDIRMQVADGLERSSRSESEPAPASLQEQRPGRSRMAGRIFFNLAIAPLLLVGALIVVAMLASRLGFLE